MNRLINLANRLLRWICKPEYLEEIEGDLFELLERRNPGLKTSIVYWFQLLNLIRPALVRLPEPKMSHSMALFRYNMAFSFRKMSRRPFYSILNVSGIAIGLASTALIGLYVLDELSFDRHWKDGERIYRVFVDIDFGTTQAQYANATAPMADIFEKEFDEVEQSARWVTSPSLTFRHNESLVVEEDIIYADQDILEIFDLQPVYGSTQHALDEPNSMVITHLTSKRYFGEENPVGHFLETSDGQIFKITCVIKDIPRNSHFDAGMLRTTTNDRWSDPSKVPFLAYWTSSAYRTYLKLKPGADPDALEKKFEAIYQKYFDPVTQEFSGQSWAEFKADGNKYNYRLQPLRDVYLKSNFQNDGLTTGNLNQVIMFTVIAAFILAMSYMNFINLTTARVSTRFKEIGIKKVVGSSRSIMRMQFIQESTMTSLSGVFIAMLLVYALYPFFRNVSGKDLPDPLWNEHQIGWIILCVGLVLGFLAALLPSQILVKIPTLSALRKLKYGKGGSSKSRKVLIVVQYTIVVFLLFGSLILFKQMRLLQNKELGYTRENILVINNVGNTGNGFEALKNSIEQLPNVRGVSAPRHVPGDLYFFGGMMYESNRNTMEGRVNCKRLWVDSAMLEVLEISIDRGRGFFRNSPRDSMNVVINRTAVKQLNLGDQPLGKSISFTDGKDESFTVIGVIDDFHVRSLKSEMFATALHYTSKPSRLIIKYDTEDIAQLLLELEKIWNSHVDDHVMNFQFGPERYNRFYEKEARLESLFNIFMVIALLLATMGLTGLSVLLTLERKKEIGIRQVLGAKLTDLIWLIGNHLTVPIILAVLVGLLSAYYVMEQWLSSFAYRIEISWAMASAPAVFVIAIAWIIVGMLTYRTAAHNPVTSLNEE